MWLGVSGCHCRRQRVVGCASFAWWACVSSSSSRSLTALGMRPLADLDWTDGWKAQPHQQLVVKRGSTHEALAGKQWRFREWNTVCQKERIGSTSCRGKRSPYDRLDVSLLPVPTHFAIDCQRTKAFRARPWTLPLLSKRANRRCSSMQSVVVECGSIRNKAIVAMAHARL